jgi:lactoylglutathione lyase
LFEAHLTVTDLKRAIEFYGGALGLELASVVAERRVAFYWLGGRGKSMLGLWEVGAIPQQMSLHVAFAMELRDLLHAAEELQAAKVQPLNFERRPTLEPDVLCWMPAASLYFRDPDGHLLEFLSMLPDAPQPDLGVVRWSEWQKKKSPSANTTKPTGVRESNY